jgi:Flp pilus assembly protein TadD
LDDQGAQAATLMRDHRWAEAVVCVDQATGLSPEILTFYAEKAVCCRKLGREAEARESVHEARRRGGSLALMEKVIRNVHANSPLQNDVLADVRDLWAQTDPAHSRVT